MVMNIRSKIILAFTEGQREEDFATWFGKSKVVDNNGNPLLVYHGTSKDFSTFSSSGKKRLPWDKDGVGHYFTPNKESAKGYGKNIISAYLRIENPKILENFEWTLISKKDFDKYTSQGYDGVISSEKPYTNISGKQVIPEKEFIVFNSDQIKIVSNTGSLGQNSLNESFRYKLQKLSCLSITNNTRE